jgi:adenylate cyclase
MRIGIRFAISFLVLAFILVSAAGVHVLWWRTAEASSRALASTINEQIVAAVEKEIESIATEARAAHTAIRTLFVQNVLETREADKREFVFLSQLQAQPTLSWIAFGWPDGSFFAAHKLGDEHLEMMEISSTDGFDKRRVDQYLVFPGDIEFEMRRFEPTDFVVTDQQWYRVGMIRDVPRWFDVTQHPTGMHPSIAYAGPIDVYQKRQGVLAIIIEHTRLSRFLAHLAVGKTGAAFILGRERMTIASPDARADELNGQGNMSSPLLGVAHRALAEAGATYNVDLGPAQTMRLVDHGSAYAVTLTPLAFPGWTLATVIPEQEFLGAVEATTRRLFIGLAILIVAAGTLSAWLVRRIIAEPLVKVSTELKRVEQFELDQIRRHPSRLAEIDVLSTSIADMATGLSAFRKYIPADLVRTLIGQGNEPRPGGSVRPMTVMFSDIAGFTGLSERLGDQIIPLLSRYLDLVSNAVNAQRGTIDKFIGDAVMAFWGAPAANPNHAVDGCRAALACQRAIRESGLRDDNGRPLAIRIGINSGDMLVGNVGSHVRLNYTVIGDAVNVASRLEAVNKEYGTDIIIGEETYRLAADALVVRELDRLAVYGRVGGLRIYELLAMAGEQPVTPDWVAAYEAGLCAYRARDFCTAIDAFQKTLALRPADRPAQLMLNRCRRFLETPPTDDWNAMTAMQTK